MQQKQQQEWFSLGVESWLLGWEAARVIWLRSMLISMGGSAGEREARRMMEEKLTAATSYGARVLSGRAGDTPDVMMRGMVRHYGRRVRANGRRLSRP